MLKGKFGTRDPLIFIFFTVLIDCIGVRIIYPVAVSIITDVSNVGVNEAIIYSGWLMMCFAIMQFIFSPAIGALSDAFGRRPVLLLSLAGLSINYCFLSIANSLSLVFIGRIISGIFSASITTGFAYVADVSEVNKRAKNFGIIGAAIGLGLIIGPLVGGLLSELGSRAPFIGAAILSIANFLYGYFVLPESLQPQHRNKFSFKKTNPLNFFFDFSRFKSVWKLLLVLFLFSLATQVLPSVWPFYTKYVYHWTDLEIGYSLAFVGLIMAMVKSMLVNKAQQVFGAVTTIYVGLLFTISGLVLFAFSGQSIALYLFILIYCIGGITSPSLQGMISEKISETEQGQLQGLIVSLISLAGILSPLIMTNLFWIFTAPGCHIFFPGISFLVAAGIVIISLTFLPKYIGQNQVAKNPK